MSTFIAVCLALIVLELAVLLAFFVVALVKMRDAAQAVEVAAYRVDQEVLSFGQSLRSGWVPAIRTLASGAVRMFASRR